jgi:hypothetical protein
LSNKSDYISISSVKNQNKIALKLTEFFTIDELNYLDFSSLQYPVKNREINDIISIFYNATFKSEKAIQLIDVLILDEFPIARYIDIRLMQGKKFQIDIKCKYTNKSIYYLSIILAKAVNFSNYKNNNDKTYRKNNIIDNYCNKVSKLVANKKYLDDVEFILDYIVYDDSILLNDNFEYDFCVDNLQFYISIKLSCIKLNIQEINTKENYSIYILRNKIGLNDILLIIEKIIKASTL